MIAVIGLGFVGLTTALGLAHKCGCRVTGYDIDSAKREAIRNGSIPFYEPNLDANLIRYLGNRFILCDALEEALSGAGIVFFCVGTPLNKSGHTDLSALLSAVASTLNHIDKLKRCVFVIKSTVPPAATKETVIPAIEEKGFKVGMDIGLVNNPEFLREGHAWDDFIAPDRIVIGEYDEKSGETIEKLYSCFEVPVHRVNLNTAEYIKYLSNTLLATLISFSNEMAMMAEYIKDIDIVNSFRILHLDKRWFGAPAKITEYLYPGCGFGGYCLPKDTNSICKAAESKGYKLGLIENVIDVNKKVKEHFVDKIASSSDKESHIGILGLSFKPGSDDVRGASSQYIIARLIELGYQKIMAYDPMAMQAFEREYSLPIKYADSLKKVVDQSDVLVVLTAWQEFVEHKYLMEGKTVIDGRYFL